MTSPAQTVRSPSRDERRERRLCDVRRGVVYLRRTDDLAHRQWLHFGSVPAIRTHVVRDIGHGHTARLLDPQLTDAQASLGDVSLSWSTSDVVNPAAGDVIRNSNAIGDVRDPKGDVKELNGEVRESDPNSDVKGFTGDARHPDSDASGVETKKRGLSRNDKKFVYKTTTLEESSSIHPKISVTEITERKGATGSEVGSWSAHHTAVSTSPPPPAADPSVSVSLSSLPLSDWPALEAGARPHTLPATKDAQHDLRELHGLPESLWRSADHPAPFDTWGSRHYWTLEGKLDLDPDPRPPGPKRYPPMSRVAGSKFAGSRSGSRRPLRTLTDFRSRNGTVRIIPPLPAIGDAQRDQLRPGVDEDEDFDVDVLTREKTYALLKRIDRLLEPSRAFFPPDSQSSQREAHSSTPSSLELSEGRQEEVDDASPRRHPRSSHAPDHVHVHNKRLQDFFQLSGDESGDVHGQAEPLAGYRQHGGHHAAPRQSQQPSKCSKLAEHQACDFPAHHMKYSHQSTGMSYGQIQNKSYSKNALALQRDHFHGHPLPLHAAVARPVPHQLPFDRPPDPHPHPLHRHGRGRRRPAAPNRVRGGPSGVERLEKQEIDLHQKCQNWIATSFSSQHRTT